ncbi:MAG TPA: LLM class F420-dependent oxidoreductase [Baekduia sp.]|nr:LLM class F420-dependent oxidoreductase [Baekduia sp.]
MTQTERKIRVGVMPFPEHTDVHELRRAWAEADELGVDTVFVSDHFFPMNPGPPGDNRTHECMVLLTAMAHTIQQAEIGTFVVGNSYRNPNLLADMFRTVDLLAGGRTILGIGTGNHQPDYDEYGYPFGTLGDRTRALAENLPIIKGRLALVDPQPPRNIPILIGGMGEKRMLGIIAEHADIWHAYVWEGDTHAEAIEMLRRKQSVLEDRCATVGRDSSEIERCVDTTGMVGDLDLDELLDAGFTFLQVYLPPPFDFGRVREVVQWRDRLNAQRGALGRA